MPQWLTLFSSCLHQCGVPRSTMGPLRAVTDPEQGWGNLHNLIGGSQQYPASYRSSEIATRSRKLSKLQDNNKVPQATKAPRQQQPSRALQVPKRTSSRALQVPKSNKLLNFNFHESPWRTQTDATDAMGKNTRSAQIIHSQIPPQATNAMGGEERKNKEELNK